MKKVNITGLKEQTRLPLNRTYRNQGKECSVFALEYVFKALKNIILDYWNKIIWYYKPESTQIFYIF